jgi:two-component system sensor kinase FixL
MLVPGVDAQVLDAMFRGVASAGDRPISALAREFEAKHADGTVFPIELSVGEAATPDGVQFIGIVRDLRPRQESERRLKEVQASLLHMARVTGMDAMGGALAHELNQPLTALIIYLQALSRKLVVDQVSLPEDAQVMLDRGLREADRAAAILRRMRQFVERREPDRLPSDINALVDEAVDLTVLGRREPVRLIKRFSSGLPLVAVDPVQIQQIIVNLVRNALEAAAASARPTVTIRTERRSREICISIADNGPGISAEDQLKLFKVFESRKRNGLGLGLAISKTIAQNHGGDVSVDPGGVGRGAQFTLHIPADAPAI